MNVSEECSKGKSCACMHARALAIVLAGYILCNEW